MALIEHGHERLLVALTIALVIGICALDLALPPEASIVALYVIPVLLSLLSAERRLTLVITLSSLSLATMGFLAQLHNGPIGWIALVNRALALATVTAAACLGLFYRRLGEEAMAAPARRCGHDGPRFKVLRGLVPICSSCKSIRDDDGRWAYLETYIEARSDAHFTHGLCPECQNDLYDRLLRRDEEKHAEPVLSQ